MELQSFYKNDKTEKERLPAKCKKMVDNTKICNIIKMKNVNKCKRGLVMKHKYLMTISGIILIILSISLLIWWENIGREKLTMKSVLIAKEDIYYGQVISRQKFTEVRSNEESIVKGAITNNSFSKIEGYIAKQYIPLGAQVVEKMFVKREKLLTPEASIFSIKKEWIGGRSSSLRKGDEVEIYSEQGTLYLGTFKVAYVKDSAEQEVIGTEANISEEIIQRDFSSSVIEKIEIFASLEDYRRLWDMAETQQIKFLFVQKGDKING